jgi:hypothetical protein
MRQFNLKCKKCGDEFVGKSGAAKACDNCRRCKECGKTLCGSYRQFCSQSCSGKFKYKNNPKCKEAVDRRIFVKTCDTCLEKFESKTGSRIRCQKCCVCKLCGKQMPNATDDFCGNSCAGKWKYRNSEKVRAAMLSGVYCEQRGKSISKASAGKPRYDLRGKNNPNWKGGVDRSLRQVEMGRTEYVQWRKSVFSRDSYKCMNKLCTSGSSKLHAHHILPWKDHSDKRYDVANGVTVCVPCHKLIHSSKSCLVQL